ncbi:GGDEF domain-containing protein [Colwellia sp. D2M02]|uniref:GGDEF domain-containing protein n=1 Tax=Colwellia sp. D2M02 TaxID=2841562 RepID=UPI001C088D54|nr:GGDEF domain-containing protein [Colwellia sp. D2M02]MBU2894097.1 GGDEF domain-containing protein [Colwellia sp. D2M02]
MMYKAQHGIIILSLLIVVYKGLMHTFIWPVDIVELALELVMVVTCCAVMYYIEQLKSSPRIYWLLLLGSGLYYFSSYFDALEEFFLEKPLGYLNIAEVVKAVGFILLFIGIHSLISRHRLLIKELKIAAQTDHLTGLLNRRAFFERMLSNSQVFENTQGAFLLMDIDHFKGINDNYGHALGDTVLADTAISLRNSTREYDILARWGGEEFLLYVNDITQDKALNIAEQLRRHVEALSFDYKGEKIHCTMSIGLHSVDVNCNVELEVACADKALYQAKSQGRNRVIVYNEAEFAAAEQKTGTPNPNHKIANG